MPTNRLIISMAVRMTKKGTVAGDSGWSLKDASCIQAQSWNLTKGQTEKLNFSLQVSYTLRSYQPRPTVL